MLRDGVVLIIIGDLYDLLKENSTSCVVVCRKQDNPGSKNLPINKFTYK